MSEQPPPSGGQDPQFPQQPGPQHSPQQPYPPYQGYQVYPPSPYQRPSSNGGKVAAIVISVIVVVVLLVCGGLFAGVYFFVRSVEDAVSQYDDDRVGGPNNPIEVAEGDAFSIDGIDYAEGWKIDPAADTAQRIVGLKGENNRDDESQRYVSIEFTFLDGNEELAEVSCNSSGDISYGRSKTLTCSGYGDFPTDWESIEVAAAY